MFTLVLLLLAADGGIAEPELRVYRALDALPAVRVEQEGPVLRVWLPEKPRSCPPCQGTATVRTPIPAFEPVPAAALVRVPRTKGRVYAALERAVRVNECPLCTAP